MRFARATFPRNTGELAMNEIGRKVAHAKRLINAGEPLKGDILEFTLGSLPDPQPNPSKTDEVWVSIARKLKAGEKLDNYEHHLMVDMVLLHVRLAAAASERSENES